MTQGRTLSDVLDVDNLTRTSKGRSTSYNISVLILPRAMNDRDEWRDRVREIRANSTL